MTSAEPEATTPRDPAPRASAPRIRWSFARSAAVILLLVLAGQVVLNVLGSFGPRGTHGTMDFILGMAWRDWIFVAFVLCALTFIVLQRASILGFFRAMHTGVMLVALSGFAVLVGVLVPQLEGFEDPDERVPSVADIDPAVVDGYLHAPKVAADDFRFRRPDDNALLAPLTNDQVERIKGYRTQFEQFEFAEAYFLYHLLHPYGIGMPSASLPPQVIDGLNHFGQRYGKEERDNREKQMKQAFGGQPKSIAITQFAKSHQDGLKRVFDVCTALHLNRTYKSNWFAALLGLLATGVALNSFRGRPADWLTTRKAGWIVVHVGILILLAGGLWSKLHTNRGLLPLDTRDDPQNEYFAYYDSAKRMRMPFYVKADRFSRKDWPTLEVGFMADQFKSRLPEYTLWPGREIGIDWVQDEATGVMRPNLRFRVKALAERAAIHSPRFWEAEKRDDERGIGPLAEFEVADAASDGSGSVAAKRPLLLKPGGPSDTYVDSNYAWRMRVVYADGDELPDRLLAPEQPGYLGALDITIATQGNVEPVRERLVLGKSVRAGDYTLTVDEATANFQLDGAGTTEVRDSRPLAEQPARNPGVWVKIQKQGEDRPERRLVLQGLDAGTHDALQKKYLYKDVVLRLAWDIWGVEGPPRRIVQWGPNTPPRLVAPKGVKQDIVLGKPLTLPGSSEVDVSRLFHNARFEKSIEFLAPHLEGPYFDEDFYSTDPIGLEVEITTAPGTPREHSETVRMASAETGLANLWQSADQSFYVRFYENQAGFPFEWRSVLSIWEPDGKGGLKKVDAGPESEREIRVNDYFFYKGYRFFQTDAKPDHPTYSGIGVVFDPGIPVVLYGMYTIIVGTILAFILRPIAQAYGKRAKEQTA